MKSLRKQINYFLVDPIKILTNKKTELVPQQESKTEVLFRFLFAITTILMFIILPIMSRNFSISGDEWIQTQYAHEVFDYFFNGGTAAYNETGRPQGYDNIIYYGGGYELLLAIVAKMFPNVFEYDVRHLVNSIAAALLFLFTGLLGKRLGGWRIGFIALLFILFAPRMLGEGINNSKDIPFALGAMFAFYHFVPFLKSLPNPSWKSVIYIALGIGFTMSIRFGGVMFIAFLAFFTLLTLLYKVKNKELKHIFDGDFKGLLLKSGAIIVLSYIICIITWPWALQNPLSNPLDSLKMMAKFPIAIRVLFDGDMIGSMQPPWYYTLMWVFRTSPEVVLLFFVLSIVLTVQLYKHFKSPFIIFLHIATIAPVAYAVYAGSSLYDGWRHFLFIYPTLAVSAALAAGYLLNTFNHKIATTSIALILTVGLILPARKIVAYHPSEIVYFNDISGGLKGNYKKYETDYYMSSARECFNKLAEKENFAQLKDTVLIVTNMYKEIKEYGQLVSPYLKFDYVKFENRTNLNYDYGIFMSRFVDYDLLLADGWPAKNAIVTVERDDVPLTFAIKKTHDGDYNGAQALNQKNYPLAIQEFEAYLKTDPTNEIVWAKLGDAYLQSQNFAMAAQAWDKAASYYPTPNNIIMQGIAHAQNNDINKALTIMQKGAKDAQEKYDNYKEQYRNNEQDMTAGSNMQMYGELAGTYYYYLGMMYNQAGNQAEANNNMSKAQRYNPRLFQK